MSAVSVPSSVPSSTSGRVPAAAQMRTFWALCERELWVTLRHQSVVFLAQALLQPIFFLFIFGRVLPSIGAASMNFGSLLFPGIMGLTLVLTALQNIALPLVIEFSWTKEIEDRLLAPLPVWAVAVQKMFVAALRAMLVALLLFPLGYLILPNFALHDVNWLVLVAILVLGSSAAAAMGLVLGTLVPPQQINFMFAIVLTPLIMTGAAYYPWGTLSNLQWFQAVTLLNPMTYASEGLRSALTPSVPHMEPAIVFLGLGISLIGFGTIGIRGFLRRAVD